MEKHAIRFILSDNKPSNPFSTVSLAEIELTMGDWQSYRKDTAFHHIGAVGGIFMVSDATKRPDPAAMERIFARHPYSPEGTILRLAWLQGLSRAEIVNLAWQQVDFENSTRSVYEASETNAELLSKSYHLPLGAAPPYLCLWRRNFCAAGERFFSYSGAIFE